MRQVWGQRPFARGFLVVTAALSFAGMTGSLARAQPEGEHPWIGVAMDPGSFAGVPPGVRVGHVVRGSPADKAGIREGDFIASVGVERVVRGAEVVQAVSSHAVGDTIDVGIVRDGKKESIHMTLAPLPSPGQRMKMDLVGAPAPAWKDIEGVSGAFPSSIGALRGRVVLLDFWATWCTPCRMVAPTLDALQARYGAEGLSVVGVSAEDPEQVALFARRTAMQYAVGADRRAETTQSYGVFSLPTVVVIDKRGVVRDVAIGYDPSEDARLESRIRELLAEPPPSGS